MTPIRYSRLPAAFRSIVTHCRTSGTWPSAEISSVPGMRMCRSPERYSLCRLSLPLMNGIRNAIATSRHASQARTSVPSTSGIVDVAPAEIVEQGDARRIGPDGDDVAHRLVDRGGGHRIRVEVAVKRVDAAADRQAAEGAEHRRDHGRIAGAVVGDADERLEDRAALDLVIVLADDPFLGRDARGGEDLLEDRL